MSCALVQWTEVSELSSHYIIRALSCAPAGVINRSFPPIDIKWTRIGVTNALMTLAFLHLPSTMACSHFKVKYSGSSLPGRREAA